MTVTRAAEAIQFAYPQIYYACHTRHQRARSSAASLSQRDAQMLVHLDRRRAIPLTRLAAHMSLAASTVSEAIARLERFGFVTKTAGANGDRRSIGIALTAKGVAAVQAGSVLETARLQAVLRRLRAADRARVCDALETLADACASSLDEKRRWSSGRD